MLLSKPHFQVSHYLFIQTSHPGQSLCFYPKLTSRSVTMLLSKLHFQVSHYTSRSVTMFLSKPYVQVSHYAFVQTAFPGQSLCFFPNLTSRLVTMFLSKPHIQVSHHIFVQTSCSNQSLCFCPNLMSRSIAYIPVIKQPLRVKDPPQPNLHADGVLIAEVLLSHL